MMQNDRELVSGTSEELSKLCATLKKGGTEAGTCSFFDNLDDAAVEACISFVRSSHPDPEEFREFCSVRGICPYEAAKRVLPYANVVSAPYPFFFIPGIRTHFLEWMGIGSCCRASLAFYNDSTDIDRLIQGLKHVYSMFHD